MASEYEREIPDWWSTTERDIYSDLVGNEPEIQTDEQLQMMYHMALFDLDIDPAIRAELHDQLGDYLWDEYGIDFDADFDWEAYREWYG